MPNSPKLANASVNVMPFKRRTMTVMATVNPSPSPEPKPAYRQLSDALLRRTKRQASTVRLYDGRGLIFVLPPSGSAYWRYDFRLGGARRSMSLGTYEDVPLATARKLLQSARELVAQGIDPVQARAAERRSAAEEITFAALLEDWQQRKGRRLAPRTKKKKASVIKNHILPALGELPARAVGAPEVLKMLRAIEDAGLHNTAATARQITGEVLRFGAASGHATRDVTTDLMDALMPAVVSHRAAVTAPRDVADLLRAIDSMRRTPQLRSALRLLALTFVRPGELRLAQWSEIDWTGKVWKVPAARTKQREDHHVPLSTQAIAELQALRALARGSRYVLPTPRTITAPLSDAAFSAALSRIGYGSDVMTPHGFRAMARTLLDEQLHESPDVIEAQLAHATRGALGDTYNRSRYIPQRTAMMQRWADYLTELERRAP